MAEIGEPVREVTAPPPVPAHDPREDPAPVQTPAQIPEPVQAGAPRAEWA